MTDLFELNPKKAKHSLTSNSLRQAFLQRKEKKRKEAKEKKRKETSNITLSKELKSFTSPNIVQNPTKKQRKPFMTKEQDPLHQLKNSNPDIKPIPLKPPLKVSVPSTVETLLTVWYDHGLSKHSSRETYRFKQDVLALKRVRAGTLFKGTEFEGRENPKFTTEEFERSVENFSFTATHPSYWPKDKNNLKSITISQFLYNPRGKKVKSWFLRSLDNPPSLLIGEGGNSRLAQEMMDIYVKNIGDGFVFDLSPEQVDHFIKGSQLADKIFHSNPNIPNKLIKTPRKKALLVFEALRSYAKGKELQTWWFANPLTYNKTLIEHLKTKVHKNVIPLTSIYQYR
jgi:hypothetical protein